MRLLPHWLASALVGLGAWYLITRPLGGTNWVAYGWGLAAAVACGAWSLFVFRATTLERSENAIVLRIERRRSRPMGLRARIRRLVVLTLSLVGVLGAVLANLLSPARKQAAAAHTGVPPNLDDSGPLPSIGGLSGESRTEPKFGHVAAVISGFGTEVRCWSVADWRKREAEWGEWHGRRLGAWGAYTTPWRPPIPNAYRIQLSPSICAMLGRLAYEDVPVQKGPWTEALAWSVAQLAHESQHVRGVWNEAEAECYGIQSINATAQALGRTSEEGQYLASLYWREAYPNHDDPAYRSDECRNGGRLDLHPETTVWP